MPKKKRLVEDRLRSMLTETTTILNSAKECLNAIEYAQHFPIKSDDVFYCTNTLAYLNKKIIEFSKQLKVLEFSKFTDAQSKDFAKIENNIALIIFTSTQLYKIYMGKDNDETAIRQGPRKLIENVLLGKVKLLEGAKESDAFYAMVHGFFKLPPELLKKLDIDGLIMKEPLHNKKWN